MTDISTPHIDPAWREAFVLALRLADATGERIGDELATVDAHCAESGESALEAFGDPERYASSLIPSALGGVHMWFAVGLMNGLLGLLIVPRAVDAWARGVAVQVTVGDIIALAVTLGLAGALMALPAPVLRWLAKLKFSPFALLGAVAVGVLAVAMLVMRDVVAEVGWPVALVIGLALLLANVATTWRDLSTADPIRDPRALRSARTATQWLTGLLFPVLTLVMVAFDAALRALS